MARFAWHRDNAAPMVICRRALSAAGAIGHLWVSLADLVGGLNLRVQRIFQPRLAIPVDSPDQRRQAQRFSTR